MKILLISTLLLFCGCSQEVVNKEPLINLQPRVVVFENENIEGVDSRVSKVNCYIFQDGLFRQAQVDVPVKPDGSATIQVEETASNIYFVTNIDSPKAYSSLVEGVTTEDEFKQKTTDVDASHDLWQSPEFYTGFYALKSDATISQKIKLSPGQSRIDVDASSDLKIKVTKISVEKAPASTFVFPNSTKLTQTQEQSYANELSDPTSGVITDALRLYESDKPVVVFMWALYDDKPILVKATIEKLDRGKIYTLKLRNGGIGVEGIFEIEDWLPGGQVDANPDANSKITIEPTHTTLPSDVTLNASNTIVSIPHTGTSELVLGFAADDLIEIDRFDGLISDVTIGPAVQSTADGKIITRYTVSVKAQGLGRLPYGVVLHLKHALRQYSYDVVSLSVAPHPSQIETVEMCGSTWMAFNARSSRLDDQIYSLDGLTVKEMYNKNWVGSIGGLFQWGRPYMYTPWMSGKNNAGGTSTNIPWTANTHMPCPEGYRVPTVAELQALLPPETTISESTKHTFTYTPKTGEPDVIEVDLRRAENYAVNIGGVTGTARYIVLHSQNTGAEMYIPLSGDKGDKSESNNPNFGHGFRLWSNSNNGTTPGWAWTTHYWPGGANSGKIGNNSSLQAEGYSYVRCIKK